LQLDAVKLRLPPGAAFSGLTAAWLHGLEVEPCNPIEVVAPPATGISSRSGMLVRRCSLDKHDLVMAQGLPATSILRTLRDLSLRLPLIEAVVIADMALHLQLTTTAALAQSVAKASGFQGVRNLRKVLDFVEPASESAMETRLRMILVLGGLPRPEAQVTIRDGWHRFVGRPDLYYRKERLGLEYDGGFHRDRLAEDNRRQNRLLEAGVRLLRFTAGDVYDTPAVVLAQVRNALAA
jgi:very-short-patch-repair endonuclease